MLEIRNAVSDDDLNGILKLQQENLPYAISAEEATSQGFVTVIHDFHLLKRMNTAAAHVIAVDGERVIGYCLSMPKEFRNEIPVLVPMFQLFDRLKWDGVPLFDVKYIVMGQVCVAKTHRGQSVFDNLYRSFCDKHRSKFEVILTEIAMRNERSLRAHQRIGFEVIHKYQAEDAENWLVVALKLH
ncbi:MAG: GNAT family N-acetyltransferase [Saprospiraceae bacterium]